MAQGMLIVQAEPVATAEADFNVWYDDVHLSEVLATPGFVRARRYRTLRSPAETRDRESGWGRYIAVYEIEGRDPLEAHAALLARVRAGELTTSDTVAAESYRSQLYEMIAKRP